MGLGNEAMIKVQNLCKSYKSGRVLSDINLHVQRGEIFGIVGQSGAGKSTLLRCINGLESFESGKVIVNDIDIARLDERAMRQFRRKIGMIFQNFALLNRKTVLDNVMLPMECWHYPQAEKRRKAEELLALVGLADKLGSLPHELSGGQKQRVAIARALTLDPDILLCDEATSALDPAITQSILELLRDVNRQLGITILMVTHDMAVIKTICKRMAIITGNRIATTGRVSDVFLAEPAELRELVGRKEIHAPAGRSLLRVALRESVGGPAALYELFAFLQGDFSIVSADIEQFEDESYGLLYLHVAAEQLEQTMRCCNQHGIECSAYSPQSSARGNG